MFRKCKLRATLMTAAVLTSVLGGSLVHSTVQAAPAEAAAMVTNPCDRLTNGQVKYSGGSANRVTFATVEDRSQSRALVTTCVRQGGPYVQDWQVWGYTGKSGFKAPGVPSGHTRYEWSPTGSYSVTEGFGTYNPGTRLSFRVLNANSRWGGGGESASNYNRYFESTRHVFPDENMWDFARNGDYTQGVIMNYNRPPDSPIRNGDGFAIFLHSNPRPTAGCISIPESWVTRYLQNAVPGDRIIMGAVDDVFTPHTSNPDGAIQKAYHSDGGQLGLGSAVSSERGGLRDGGAYQNFERGSIHWSPNSGAQITYGAIGSAWGGQGWENGKLGYPTSGEAGGLRSGGAYQNFQGGSIHWSPSTGAKYATGAILAAWGAQGWENGELGYPTTNEVGGLKEGGATQNFQSGTIVYSPATGAVVSKGAIRSTYAWAGYENGTLGYPVANEIGGLKDGGVYQNYQSGSIHYSPATGALITRGPVLQLWGSTGWENGKLGYPTTNERFGLRDGGSQQKFQGGEITRSPYGTFMSGGAILTTWVNNGSQDGRLGYPTSSEYVVNGVATQDYEGGQITWTPSTGARVALK